MKNNNKSTNLITFNIKEHSGGEINRNSPAHYKTEYVSEIFNPSFYQLVEIKNGLEVTVKPLFHNKRNSKGQFSRK